MKNALIVGGSSGLGLELARLLREDHEVIITGRSDPKEDGVQFIPLELSFPERLGRSLSILVDRLPRIDLFVYAAGFFQKGTMTNLCDADIMAMESVGMLAPAMLLQRILRKQGSLPGFIAITSTSQWTPRLLEPMYTATKAGLAMLANSVSLDERVGKVLVAAPAGMKTRFWEASQQDTSAMLDPVWVADQILAHYAAEFEYSFIRILRGEPRVEVVETRS